MNRLLPTMPPTLKGIPFIYDDRDRILYAAALSDNQLDAFLIHFKATVGIDLIPIAASLPTAAKRRRINVADWSKTSFSPRSARRRNGRHARPRFPHLALVRLGSPRRHLQHQASPGRFPASLLS